MPGWYPRGPSATPASRSAARGGVALDRDPAQRAMMTVRRTPARRPGHTTVTHLRSRPMPRTAMPHLSPLRRRRRRGVSRTGVLFLLAALFLIVSLAGLVVAKQALQDLPAVAERLADNITDANGMAAIPGPGEHPITARSEGGLVILVADEVTVDGTTYRYDASKPLTLDVVSEGGTHLDLTPIGGGPSVRTKERGTTRLVAWTILPNPGTYKVSMAGQDALVVAFAVTGQDWADVKSLAYRGAGGGAAMLCGLPLFIVLGLVAIVLRLFRRRPAAQSAAGS